MCCLILLFINNSNLGNVPAGIMVYVKEMLKENTVAWVVDNKMALAAAGDSIHYADK